MFEQEIDDKLLFDKLEEVYREYLEKEYVLDPIMVPARYQNELDIELIGFITSVYSFGGIPKIVATTNSIANLLGSKPFKNLLKFQEKDYEPFKRIHYRFYTGDDLVSLLKALKTIYKTYGSLQNLFKEVQTNVSEENKIIDALVLYSGKLRELGRSSEKGFRYMLPNPESGSACKRLMMFLRWMVRTKYPDFGIWNAITPAELIIPLDTHIKKVALELGLTTRTTPDMKMAKEITKNLARYDHDDPIKYDFSLCHMGVDKNLMKMKNA